MERPFEPIDPHRVEARIDTPEASDQRIVAIVGGRSGEAEALVRMSDAYRRGDVPPSDLPHSADASEVEAVRLDAAQAFDRTTVTRADDLMTSLQPEFDERARQLDPDGWQTNDVVQERARAEVLSEKHVTLVDLGADDVEPGGPQDLRSAQLREQFESAEVPVISPWPDGHAPASGDRYMIGQRMDNVRAAAADSGARTFEPSQTNDRAEQLVLQQAHARRMAVEAPTTTRTPVPDNAGTSSFETVERAELVNRGGVPVESVSGVDRTVDPASAVASELLQRDLAAADAPGIAEHVWKPDAELTDQLQARRAEFGAIGITSESELADHVEHVIRNGDRIVADRATPPLADRPSPDDVGPAPTADGPARTIYFDAATETVVVRNDRQGDGLPGTVFRTASPEAGARKVAREVSPRRGDEYADVSGHLSERLDDRRNPR